MTDEPTFFEDVDVGMEWRTAERLIDRQLIADFAGLSGDRTPVHLDPEAARRAGYADVVAHGILVKAVAIGLLAGMGVLAESTLATRRLHWEFTRPVLPGTVIHCHARVAGKRASSEAAGLVDLDLRVIDEAERTLQRGSLRLVVRRR